MMQERIRFMEEMYPGRVVYNTPSAHRLTGPLDRVRFEEALQAMIRRQPALRTQIARSAQGTVQRVLDDVDLSLPFEDLQAVPAALREGELMQRIQDIVDRPIPLDEAPLFRVALYRTAPEEHVFLFMAHHIVWDGWSFDLLYEEISAAYGAALSGQPSLLAAPPVTYLDFADWHDKWVRSDECLRQIAFWKERFSKVATLSPLPTDHPARLGHERRRKRRMGARRRVLTERFARCRAASTRRSTCSSWRSMRRCSAKRSTAARSCSGFPCAVDPSASWNR